MEVNFKIVAVFTVLLLAVLVTECVNGYDHLPASEITNENAANSIPNKRLEGRTSVDRLKDMNVKGTICPLCLFVGQSIQDKLKNTETKENIKKTLESMCSYLPGDTGEQCHSLIIEYFDAFVDIFLADFPPEKICAFLKLCKDPGLHGRNIGVSKHKRNFTPFE